ncbi:MAG: DNA repair protein RecN, partial [Bacteroidales bacterium]|nr:DNA repair protein RecN [Bacteroidales bacterium]
TDKGYQLSVLDYFAATEELLANYKKVHSDLQRAQAELAKIERENAVSAQEREYKEFQLAKLQEASLIDGELEELELEQKQLANAEQIKGSLHGSLELLRPMGSSVVQNFKEAINLLRKCYTFVPELEELGQRLESCRIECKDIEQELEDLAEGITASPQRLQIVDDRIALIEDLLRRYNCSTVAELIEYRDKLKDELDGAFEAQEQVEVQQKEVAALMQLRQEKAMELSGKRREKVIELSQVLRDKVRNLEMPYAEFEVELTDLGNCTESGRDDIRFLFAANGGSKLVEISKVASGGELSRIMLCLKALMAQYIGMPTMIFDEIDTGVSGSIADKMGELIGQMGKNMQVFAITHLPQIAVKGETHLLVYKEFDADKQAHTSIKLLTGDERVNEVARMLSGAQLSQAAVENAKYLLSNNS